MTITSTSSGGLCTGQTATLTVSGASTYTWSPGGATTTSISVSPSSTQIYTVSGTSGGCIGTNTIGVLVSPSPTVSIIGTYSICSGGTTSLTASGATSYTWNPPTSFATPYTNPTPVSPTVTTTYTVQGSNPGCSNISSATVTVNLVANQSVTISPINYTLCSGSAATFTASGATSYSWTPATALSCTNCASPSASPTVTTTYSVTGTYTNGCPISTNTITIPVLNSSCSGAAPSSYTITTSGLSYTASPAYINQNMYIGVPTGTVSPSYTINSTNVSIAPNVTITVQPNATLTINGSWLHACAQCNTAMWQGIVIQDGGKLIINNNSIIEDAVQAVSTAPSNTVATVPAWNISNTIFNKNNTDINIANKTIDLSANTIYNCIFTCRSLYSHTTTPSMFSYLKNDISSAITNTYTSSSPVTTTIAGPRSQYGIYITRATYTVSPILIGSTTTPTLNINIFDNLDYGIYDYSSALTIKNNRFQNITGNSAGSPTVLPKGIGIYATEDNNYNLIIGNANTTLNNNEINYFYNCLFGVGTDKWASLYINNNRFYNAVTASVFNTPNSYVAGQAAVYNNRFNSIHGTERMMFNSNVVQNYATGLFTDFGQIISTGAQVYMAISNTITATGSNYCNYGMQFTQSGASTGAVAGANTSAFTLFSNTITNIKTNCIYLSSINTPTTGTSASFAQVSLNNELSLKYVNTYTAPGAAAIGIANCNNITVSSNYNIKSLNTGTYSAFNNQYLAGIYIYQSPGSVVTCNKVANLGEGYVWHGNNLGSQWLENLVNNSRYGLVLRSAGVMGDQGSAGHPIADIWGSSTDITSAQTLSDNSFPDHTPTTSKLFIVNSTCATASVTLPCTNAVSLAGGTPFSTSSSTVTLNVTTGSSPGLCSWDGGGGAGAATMATSLSTTNTSTTNTTTTTSLQSLLTPSTTLPIYDTENKWATQHYVSNKDQTIATMPGYENAKTFALIDQQMAAGNYSTAQNSNNAISPVNIIETNWQKVNAVLLKQALSATVYNYTTTDINNLNTVATQCPITGGSIVWKARAMLNSYYGAIIEYPSACASSNGAKSSKLAHNADSDATIVTDNQMLRLYPNPNDGNMLLEYSITNDATIQFTDIAGKVVCENTLSSLSNTAEIRCSNLLNGLYLYRIISNNQLLKTGKVVIMK